MEPKFKEGNIVKRKLDGVVIGTVSNNGIIYWENQQYSGYIYLFTTINNMINGYYENQLECVYVN